jgi:hypothetical protein
MSLVSQIQVDYLSPAQLANAKIIEREFYWAGLPAGLTAAALANAWHESRLNERAHRSEGEDSAGLFQLNAQRGLGTGMTLEERFDPVINTQRIIKEIKAKRLDELAKQNPSVPYLAKVFANKIEKCSACGYQDGDSELHVRAATATEWFPMYVGYGLQTWMIPAAVGTATLVALGLYYYTRVYRRA